MDHYHDVRVTVDGRAKNYAVWVDGKPIVGGARVTEDITVQTKVNLNEVIYAPS